MMPAADSPADRDSRAPLSKALAKARLTNPNSPPYYAFMMGWWAHEEHIEALARRESS